MSRPRGLARRRLVCRQAVELVTDYLDGALSPAARRRFEKHLASCPHCTEYRAQIEATMRLAGQVAPAELPAQMRADLVELYRRWRDDEDVRPPEP